jgi:putative DNA primase/helicase
MIGPSDCLPDWLSPILDNLDPDGKIRAALDAPRGPAPTVAAGDLDRFTPDERIRRARGWLARVPAAVQGQNGSGATYAAACGVVHGFAVDPDAALDLLLAEYNPKCLPPWSARELGHKVDDAIRKQHAEPVGYLLLRGSDDPAEVEAVATLLRSPARPAPPPAAGRPPTDDAAPAPDDRDRGDVLEHDDDPYRVARGILAGYGNRARRSLAYWRGEFYEWGGSRWVAKDRNTWTAAVNAATRRHFEAVYRFNQKLHSAGAIDDVPKMGRVTRPLVSNVVAALEAESLVDVPAAPAWIRGAEGPDPAELVAARNGIVSLPAVVAKDAGAILDPTPSFFNLNAVDYPVDLGAPRPVEWLRFLSTVWPDDAESIALLQEWFGYLLTTDTSQQKMLLLIGPKRSGKGTIINVLRSLVGPDNCCGPTLSGLAGPFGLAPLLGKTVATIDDARLSARADGAVVAERLLLISGEARSVTVERKHMDSVNTQIRTRFVVATNEAPRLADLSGALASRWSVLQFVRSFYGQEDRGLIGRLLAELPGIFLWAVEGWDRLRKRGRFSRPASADDAVEMMEDSGSPIGVFVKEQCEAGQSYRVPCDDLYAAWKGWCHDTGRKEPGTREEFGRQIRAAVPGVKRAQARTPEGIVGVYRGVRLNDGATGATGVTGYLSLHAQDPEEETNRERNGQTPVTPVTPVTPDAGEGVDL